MGAFIILSDYIREAALYFFCNIGFVHRININIAFSYYGEMITYLGMTAPMAILALIEWLRNPFEGNTAEVEVNRLNKNEYIFMSLITALVTAVFYFILKALGTSNLVPGTISVTTSFAAVYLTFRRSPLFALAYAANYAVLIFLWTPVAISDISYISVIVCFAAFLINDIYGFISWKQMERRQNKRITKRVMESVLKNTPHNPLNIFT